MTIFLVASILSTIVFGTVAVFISLREEKAKKELEEQKKEVSRRYYETLILKQLSEEISYSLDLKKVVETIVSTVENLFELSTATYALVDDEKIVVRTYIKQAVNFYFVEQVKRNILDSMYNIDPNNKQLRVFDFVQGPTLDDDKSLPLSYFNIPLVLNSKFMGMINISSSVKNIYQEKDMSIFYKIVNDSMRALERLQEVIETEKGKLDSLVMTLPSGTILLSLDAGLLNLSTINYSAKEFLKLKGAPDITSVISSFDAKYNMMQQIKDVFREKKSVVIKDAQVFDRFFTIYINPIFVFETEKIIGISITMHDKTIDKEVEAIRDTFTNMVVHDLRAPLTSIKGASELLIRGDLEQSEDVKMLHIIKTSTETMLDSIGDLLDASKIEAGKFSIYKEMKDINKLVSEKALAFSYVATDKHISIKTNLSPISLFGFDQVRVGQVLNNLISNSIKYTNDMGEIDVITKCQNGVVQVIVKDNGVGIPADKMSLLFSRYGQIEGPFRRKGTGLGLYISKGIVESHGGKIWVDSEEGSGTTVTFTLPYVAVSQKQEAEVKPVAAQMATTRVVN